MIALEVIAEALGDLKKRCFLTGGVSIPFYITDQLEEAPRATLDIDVALEVYSAREYYDVIEKQLRSRGFNHDLSQDAPICRWRWEDLVVDIMPVDENVLGFANPWYRAGLDHTIPLVISEKCHWRILSAPYALAAKLAAFWSRGVSDPGNSHDLEDILTIINGRAEIVQEMEAAPEDCRQYVANSCFKLLNDRALRDVLAYHLPYGIAGQQRLSVVLERLKRLSLAQPPP